MAGSKRICPRCGRKMKQQFIGLYHCKCGLSLKKDIGYFERTPDMIFCLKHNKANKKPRRLIEIRYQNKQTKEDD